MPSRYKLIIITLLAMVIFYSAVNVSARNQSIDESIATGYSVLKIFLEDEQHLTTIRRTKMVITFSDISDHSKNLIDDIANSSEQALMELDAFAQQQPVLVFEDFSEQVIAKATLDSLRMETAKEFLFEADNFEKNLLLSQLKVLPVISHLAEQLEKKETNQRRKAWLDELAKQYKDYYQQVDDRISLASPKV